MRKVLKSNRWPDPDMTLQVELAGTRLPVETVITIDLFRGNEGPATVQLNPRIYRRMAPGSIDSAPMTLGQASVGLPDSTPW
ncbi:MAG: hypothetical protein M3R60_03250 [Pseudomonadota bacterium]|nr:hypothetical protein [Pseudomonadota bacterium]